MKRSTRKLALRVDTLRALTTAELGRAGGGLFTASYLVCPSWPPSCGCAGSETCGTGYD